MPKRGYEFVCPAEPLTPIPAEVDSSEPKRSTRRLVLVGTAALLALALAGVTARRLVGRSDAVPIVAVARLDNETGDASLARFGDVLTDTVVEQLTQQSGGRYAVVGNAAILRRPREQRDLQAIASSLHANFVVLSQLQRDDERLRVLAHLIRLPDQTHVSVSRTDGVAGLSLTATDAIAARIASAFAARLRDGRSVSSPAAAAH